ncbi:MAG: ABC transporter permease subunit [Chloroflexota bacterium]
MSGVAIVFRKEIRELVTTRSTVLTGIGFVLFFGVMYSLRVGAGEMVPLEQSLGSVLFFLTSLLGVFLGYTMAAQVFLREKIDAVIETLLCAPVRLGEIWLGKTMAVTAFAGVLAIGAGVLMSLVVSLRAGSPIVVSTQVLFHLLVGVPLLTACLVGALGFAQLLFGMKENRIIGLALFIPIFAGLYGLGYTSAGAFVISWTGVLLLSFGALTVLVVLLRAARRISKERIVTSLP